MPAAKREKGSELSSILADFAKESDLHTIGLDEIAQDVEVIPTGNMELDLALGVGGFPRGRSGEFYGPPGSGKSSTALQMAGFEVQRIKRERTSEHVLFSDYEHALDFEYAEKLGVDPKAKAPDGLPIFLYNAPDTLEQGVELIKKAVRTNTIRLVILDSLAAMTPQKFAEGEVTQAQEPGLQAKLIRQFGTQMNSILSSNNCAMVFLNHEAKEITMGGGPKSFAGPKTTTPGGNGPKFFASVRLSFTQFGTYKGKVWDEVSNSFVTAPTGHDVKVKVVKNKVSAPFKEVTVRTRHGHGLDNFISAWKVLKLRGRVIDGTWSGTDDPQLIPEGEAVNKEGKWQKQGEDKILKFADTHPVWRQTMIDAALEELAKSKSQKDLLSSISPTSEELEDSELTDSDE